MRFLSFLPMLLLLAGSLGAQNQCSIFDLNATVSPIDPATCQYYIALNFQHTGTTNQYTVKGNGVDYGTFSYDSVPVKLGPFTAGTSPSVKEFVVTDLEFQDCQDNTTAQIPACTQSTTCDIYDLKVETGDCNPGGLTYKLTVNFKYTNPGNDFFEVWSANGTYLGIYPLGQLPLTIPVYPWNGDPVDQIKVCINDHPDCCETLSFNAPDCNSQSGCSIAGISVDPGDCTSDSTYKVKINFSLNGPSLIDQFGLWANNEFLGVYGMNELPLNITNFPWNGGSTDFVRICVLDVVIDPVNPQIVCCDTLEFQVPGCLPAFPCSISDLTAKADSCTSDSTFGVWIDFAVNDSTGVDTFYLSGNGHDLGAFSYDSLPLYIADFPWNNGIFSHIKVCTGNSQSCCKEFQFLAPDCLPYDTCEVTDIFVQTGPCTSDSTYKLRVNFQATNPGNGTFTIWANGDALGTFALDTIPFVIDSFPWGGNDVDVVKICINDTTAGFSCCREKEFHAPVCVTGDSCSITNVVVDPGDCNPGGDSYSLTLNFQATNPGNDFFELWTGSGVYLGYFPLNQLPLTIPAFPCNNSGVGVLKICINDNPDCCTTIEFQAPGCCSNNDPCEISNLTVQTGACTSDHTYEVTLDFDVTNPLGNEFGVWANGDFLGTYPLDSLPLFIPDFPWNGGPNDVVKVCFTNNGMVGCCKTLEFNVPDCLPQPCEIYNMTVETGTCTGDSTYNVWINFQVANPPGNTVGVWANGEFLGTYNVDSLPIHIEDFPWNGGPNDVVKVCFVDPASPDSSATCCRVKEFAVPDCIDQGGPCEIYDLVVDTGDCTSDSTYNIWINFQVDNPPGNTFGVWANGEFLGNYSLDSLPLHIEDFPWNGGPNDVVKVCFQGTNCCRIKEFEVPDCLNQGGPCHIYDLVVDTGDCTSDSTYSVTINFQVDNPPADSFGLWANGEFFGTFSLSDLPLTIPNFPWDGGPEDHVKVCFFDTTSSPGQPFCCLLKPFMVPDCLNPGGPCEIYDLTVETGDCNGNDSYEVWINFQVDNPPGDQFGVWANGNFLGLFDLDSLPLYIPDFPTNGGSNDVVKVCFPTPNGGTTCCRTKEFDVPDCIGQDPCHIYDVKVVKTPCLCGQFFALVTFKFDNVGDDGFDIFDNNGNQYGNYPYNFPQPVIIGPFNGDGTTDYGFIVKDHQHPDCADDYHLGTVDCMTPVVNPGSTAKLALSPNPTSNWLNVTAQLQNGTQVGEATVEIYHADGRLVQTLTVSNGNNFQVDVADLPAGVYRLALMAASGRVEGTFAKQ